MSLQGTHYLVFWDGYTATMITDQIEEALAACESNRDVGAQIETWKNGKPSYEDYYSVDRNTDPPMWVRGRYTEVREWRGL